MDKSEEKPGSEGVDAKVTPALVEESLMALSYDEYRDVLRAAAMQDLDENFDVERDIRALRDNRGLCNQPA